MLKSSRSRFRGPRNEACDVREAFERSVEWTVLRFGEVFADGRRSEERGGGRVCIVRRVDE